ncbi:GAF domain-containing protein [Methylobacterium sp. B4]|uniref:sensor histidine kinase n=1 Tax=Methylobacterium sp. B4 TaxID=1938755 RepID=UPI000D756FBD|nr:GAF domain-containing protein [Methylobacterium sp. B4]PXW63066.1 two-component sensor histidine kinase [Methylobacterium sp. B4]
MIHRPESSLTPDTSDPDRLAELEALEILDTVPEEGFDDAVQIARLICHAPVALISLVAADRQWFKARAGFPDCETDLGRSVCAYALSAPDLLVIPDLSTDPRTRNNPLVTGEPHIRFYAGAPLRTPSGHVMGSLCVIDHRPRPEGLTEAQQDGLRRLARQVMILLRERRQLARMQAAEVLTRAAAARRAALIELGDHLRDRGTVEEMTATAAEIVGRTLNGSRAGYGELDASGRFVSIPRDWSLPGELSLVGRHRLADYGSLGPVIERGDTLVVSDVGTDGRTAEHAAPFGAINITAMLNVPVRERGRTVGLLFVHSPTVRSWAPEEIAFARNVADRVQVGLARLRAEEQQAVLNKELAHRLKNTLAIVQSIATQTLRGVAERPLVEAFERRVLALSRAHDVLMQSSWTAARMRAAIESVLAMQADHDSYALDGPDLDISPQAALSLSLLLHELATNALKYGALSAGTGRVRVTWHVEEGQAPSQAPTLVLGWTERGGPGVTAPSGRGGFGSKLIRMGLVGTRAADIRYDSVGLRAEFRAPLADMQPQAD